MNKLNHCCEKCIERKTEEFDGGVSFTCNVCTNAHCDCHADKTSMLDTKPQHEGWEAAFDYKFPGIRAKIGIGEDESIIVGSDIKSFIRTHIEAAQEDMRRRCIDLAKKHAHSVKKADKTPRYSYSGGKKAENANGELPDGGRWKNCDELADDLVHSLEAITPNKD